MPSAQGRQREGGLKKRSGKQAGKDRIRVPTEGVYAPIVIPVSWLSARAQAKMFAKTRFIWRHLSFRI